MKINPYNETIYGYEDDLKLEIIISFMLAIIKGDKFPKVKMVQNEDKSFELIYPGVENFSGADGGHHRTYATILLGKDLDIEILEKKPVQEFNFRKINIKSISVRSSPTDFNYQKKVNPKKYRELPTVEEMFSKHKLIVNSLKYGASIELTIMSYTYIFEKNKELD